MNWPVVALADVAEFQRDGVAPADIQTGTRYLGLEHIEAGGRIIGGEPIENGELASTKFLFSASNVLYGKLRPYLGKIALPEFDGVCSTDIVPINPSDRLDRRFLAYFLRQPSMVDYANSRSTGANLPRLSPKALAEFEIPLPPLSEQKRIAGILDEAARLCRLRARALEKLNTLGQAIFRTESERASETVKITDLAQINPRRRFETDEDFPVSFLPMAAVSENGDITDPEERQLNDVRKGFTYFEDGDVLVAKITPCFENGKGCLVSGLAHEVGFGSTEFHVLRTPDPLMREWLHLATRSDAFRHAGERSMTGSAGQKRVPAGFISDFEVRLPTADRLEKINEALNTIGKRRQEIARAAVAGNQLFASLQHRAFRGEL